MSVRKQHNKNSNKFNKFKFNTLAPKDATDKFLNEMAEVDAKVNQPEPTYTEDLLDTYDPEPEPELVYNDTIVNTVIGQPVDICKEERIAGAIPERSVPCTPLKSAIDYMDPEVAENSIKMYASAMKETYESRNSLGGFVILIIGVLIGMLIMSEHNKQEASTDCSMIFKNVEANTYQRCHDTSTDTLYKLVKVKS